MKKRTPLHKKYSSTFYIFPVFLPLAELLPWLLTVIGALAAVTQVLSRKLWNHKRNRVIVLTIGAICLASAGVLVAQRILTTPSVEEGSEPVLPANFSRLETFQLPPASKPAPSGGVFSLLWKTDSPDQNIARPAVNGNLLLVGTYKGTLDALRIADGERLWTLHKHEQVFATPSFYGNLGFIGEGHHTSPAAVLTAFTFPEGTPVWERKFRSHLESSPVTDGAHGRLWLSAGEVGLWALDMKDGKNIWRSAIGHCDIPPLFQTERLFAAAKINEESDGSALFEINPDTGAVIRSTAVPGNPMGNLLAAKDGEMVLATAIGQVGVKRGNDAGWAHGFTADGALRWTARLPAMPLPESVLLKDKSILFYTLNNGSLIALNTFDGSVAWQVQVGGAFQTDATLIEDGKMPLLVAITAEGIVTVRNAINGREVQNFAVEPGDSYPLYHDGILYISTPYNVRAYAGVGG